MKRIVVLLMISSVAMAAVAQPVDFSRIREGSRVVLVLGTGGECQGKVVRRTDGMLAVKLTAPSPDCGARDAVVNVRESNTQSAERAEASRRKKIGKRAAAIGVATAVGLLVLHVPSGGALAVLGGGAEGVHIMNRELDKGDGSSGYMFVSRLE
jgi:hypothetical protein